MLTILIAEDDRGYLQELKNHLLEEYSGRLEIIAVTTPGDAKTQIQLHQHNIRCVVLDYEFRVGQSDDKPWNGLQLGIWIKEGFPNLHVILMSSKAKIHAVREIEEHGFAILDKEDTPGLLSKLYKLLPIEQTTNTVNNDREVLAAKGFLTGAPSMDRVCRSACEAAAQDYSVLIIGEQGTGKTLLARIIHEISTEVHGREDNWVRYDPMDMGSATMLKKCFTTAGSGTFIADDLQSMSHSEQIALRNILHYGKEPIARVIAVTTDVSSLRQDLYSRFRKIIYMPSLYQRREDIPMLVQYFITCDKEANIDDNVIEFFRQYPWEHNLWQLRRVLGRAVQQAQGRMITVDDLQYELAIEHDLKSKPEPDMPILLQDACYKFVQQIRSMPRGFRQDIVGGAGYNEVNRCLRNEIRRQILEEVNGNQAEAARRLCITAIWDEI